MTQDDLAVVIRPVERILGQDDDGSERAPGNRCADDAAGKQAHVACHTGLLPQASKNFLPVGIGQWPAFMSNATEPNPARDEPGDDDDESERPEKQNY